MDEPFGALDAMTKALLQDELMRVMQQNRTHIRRHATAAARSADEIH
jgi:ABC-type nitrate/sulfonate/bicarbonate transport system ATPase subunit